MAIDAKKELDFDINGFQDQKVLSEAEGYANQILMLLFLRKGDYPSDPTIGINISRRMRYKDMDMLTGGELKADITNQIRRYAPSIPLDEVNLYPTKVQGQYIILIEFILTAEKVKKITLALARTSSTLINYKFDFN